MPRRTPVTRPLTSAILVLLLWASISQAFLPPRHAFVVLTPRKTIAALHSNNNDNNKQQQQQNQNNNDWNNQHLIHGIDELHEETAGELRATEDAAAWDAHDCSDPGVEAAAEERAVMIANELIHKMKEKAKQQEKGDNNK